MNKNRFHKTFILLGFGLVCCFISQSTAMVMLGRSDHLTTLFFPVNQYKGDPIKNETLSIAQ